MAKDTLTIIDTTRVQGYIFGSNRLRENLGASQLVEMATQEFLREALDDAGLRHNRTPGLEQKRIEDGLDVEVILQGGGNALLRSRSEDLATAAVRHLSRLLVQRAPGLEIAVAHHTFDWETQALGGAHGEYEHLLGKLNRAKQQRQPSTPLLGLGVTLECRSTGLPAVDFHYYGPNDEQAVSADVFAKVHKNTAHAAKDRFVNLVKTVAAGYEIPSDLDELGGTRDDSRYIAVVHIDGNGIGNRFREVVRQHDQPGPGNNACLAALQTLSRAVADAGTTALQQTVKRLVETLNDLRPEISETTRAAWHAFKQGLKQEDDGAPKLPLRPIVFGGDDVTFVCDGRLGLPLAALYLQAWEQASRHLPYGGQAYACAGVAVVKTHYPFARAYTLADDLCRHAKSILKEDNIQASALDWHFAFSGIFGDIRQIREREYRVGAGNLSIRPLMLSQPALKPAWRTWPTFKRLVGTFAGDLHIAGSVYANRNKVKGLGQALRSGGDAVKHFLSASRLGSLPPLDASTINLQETGWASDQCGYSDAIEAIDFFLPIEPWETL